MSTFAEVMAQVAECLGIEEGLVPDEDGICELISEEADIVIMDCPDADGAVLMTAKLMDPPSGEDETLLSALKANHRLAATKGASISLDEADGSLALSVNRPLASLDGPKMVALIEEFTATLLSLRETMCQAG